MFTIQEEEWGHGEQQEANVWLQRDQRTKVYSFDLWLGFNCTIQGIFLQIRAQGVSKDCDNRVVTFVW